MTPPIMVFIAIGMLAMLLKNRAKMRRNPLIIQVALFSALLVVAFSQWTHII
ncbi:MAG: hypothetical protein M0T78_10800 [Actinomycetota bacterium]|nr:hypothetical protein [Actinomycetota bacterium]